MRKSITLFDDQYAFYKELKSEKLLVAFVEYSFEDKTPEWLNSMEQIIRNSLLPRMDKWKSKFDAWSKWGSKSHGWWATKWNQNAKKTTSKTTTKQQAKNNQVKVEVKVKEEDEVKEKENIETNSNELVEQSSISKEITDLINLIKDQCSNLGIAYDKSKDRYFAKFILTAKEFGDFSEKIWQTRTEFALNVLKASMQIKFRKWICSWPMKIYQNYSEVYNETLRMHSKNSKNLIQSF